MKTTIIAATMNDDQFTREALEQLRDSAVGVPVTMDFDLKKIVGKVTGSKVTDAGLEITIESTAHLTGMFIVPGYRAEDYKAVTFGATSYPQDKTLPKI